MVDRLVIKLDTRGDHTANNMAFSPEMVLGPSARGTDTLYFTPTIKLTNSLLSAADVPDGPSTFMKVSEFKKLIDYSAAKLRKKKKLSLQKAKDTKVVDQNVEFIVDMLLKPREKLFINGRAYIIGKVKVVEKGGKVYTESVRPASDTFRTVPGSTRPGKDYTAHVSVSVLDASKKPGEMDFVKLGCSDRAMVIEEQAKELLGITLDLMHRVAPTNIMRPVLATGPQGYTTGKAPARLGTGFGTGYGTGFGTGLGSPYSSQSLPSGYFGSPGASSSALGMPARLAPGQPAAGPVAVPVAVPAASSFGQHAFGASPHPTYVSGYPRAAPHASRAYSFGGRRPKATRRSNKNPKKAKRKTRRA